MHRTLTHTSQLSVVADQKHSHGNTSPMAAASLQFYLLGSFVISL